MGAETRLGTRLRFSGPRLAHGVDSPWRSYLGPSIFRSVNRPPGLTEWVLTPHAEYVMRRRGISIEVVTQVVAAPDQRFHGRPGRDVLQRRLHFGDPPGEYVVRAFVDVDRSPAEVVTVYRTSKIQKYWRPER